MGRPAAGGGDPGGGDEEGRLAKHTALQRTTETDRIRTTPYRKEQTEMVQITKPECNVEDGLYTLRIGDSTFVTVQDFKTGEDVQRIEFVFLCTDGPSEGEEFTDLTSTSTGPRSKLGRIYRAAMQTEVVPPDWDTEDLKGKRFQALVQANDNGYARVSLDSIKPAKARKKSESNGHETPVGQTLDEAKKKAKVRAAEAEDDESETWDDEDDA
jgi:hypothetical protein